MLKSNIAIKISRIGILVLVILLTPKITLAQTACTQVLDQARTTFDDGQIQRLPGLLEPCLESEGFTEAEKTEALRLLVLTHVYMEQPDKANSRMLELLHHDHEYAINEAVDPTEFILLYQTFRTKPIFAIGLKGGLNATIVNPTEVNGTFNLNSPIRGEYGIKLGFHGGLSFEYELNDKFTINSEFWYSVQSFEKTSTQPLDPASRIQGSGLNMQENQSWLKIPISGQYLLKKTRFNPFVSLGVSIDLLLTSKTASDVSKLDFDGVNTFSAETLDLLDGRESLNLAIFAGVGSKVKVGEGFIVGDLRFNYGLLDMVASGSFYDNPLVFGFNDAHDQFKLHTITFTIGYMKNIYKPKKYY